MTTERRSRIITEGDERAPNRSMLRAVGFGGLAERAEAELRRAGTMPQLFGTITVSDGISMGTEGMKYSLVSREIIADSIETVCSAQAMDGVLAIGGCDKNMPGALMAFPASTSPPSSSTPAPSSRGATPARTSRS